MSARRHYWKLPKLGHLGSHKCCSGAGAVTITFNSVESIPDRGTVCREYISFSVVLVQFCCISHVERLNHRFQVAEHLDTL